MVQKATHKTIWVQGTIVTQWISSVLHGLLVNRSKEVKLKEKHLNLFQNNPFSGDNQINRNKNILDQMVPNCEFGYLWIIQCNF